MRIIRNTQEVRRQKKRWYDILQEVYSNKKNKINERIKEEIKEMKQKLKMNKETEDLKVQK